MTNQDYVKFEVAPNIVQDLGLNLYTSVARVLVEFVANSYDADSPDARISLDEKKISAARQQLKAQWLAEKAQIAEQSGATNNTVPLELRTLPENVEIVIEDRGHGMSKQDLENKFLMVGRRRRDEEQRVRSDNGRILMGRKGLGKLAGFGVAQRVTVTSRKKGEAHATQITLDYEELIKTNRMTEVKIPAVSLSDGGGIVIHGTRIVLSKLVYDPVKNKGETITRAIAEHFSLIETADFAILFNGHAVQPEPRNFAYAFPQPDLPVTDLVEHTYKTEEGEDVTFKYRVRFTQREQHLSTRERGVRIYANGRLAAIPDLLDMKTGVHGHRNTHYLDGVVHADFIDEQKVDYIATDRQTLRWEAPLLEPMREFLTKIMQDACNEYQKTIDAGSRSVVRADKFSVDTIDQSNLPRHRKALAWKIAAALNLAFDDGIEGKDYKTQLPILINGIGQGDILHAISKMADTDHPNLDEVIAKLTELTAREFGDFIPVVQGRLNGIDTLKKLYEDADFKAAKNEEELHDLLEENPWLIDPTFTQFLTSNQTENELNKRLAVQLQVAHAVPEDYDKTATKEADAFGSNKRPDLVFLLSNTGLHRVVIVELKAPNTPLHNGHLDQLKAYIRRAKAWLKEQGGEKAKCTVAGYLIGSKADADIHQELVEALRYEIEQRPDRAEWYVFDIGEVLDAAKEAHSELLKIHDQHAAASSGAD